MLTKVEFILKISEDVLNFSNGLYHFRLFTIEDEIILETCKDESFALLADTLTWDISTDKTVLYEMFKQLSKGHNSSFGSRGYRAYFEETKEA